MCRSAAKVGQVQSQSEEPQKQDLYTFIGAVEEQGSPESNPCTVTLEFNGDPIMFCMDTGAEVTVVSE